MKAVRAEHLRVVLDNGCSLDWMVRESGVRLELFGKAVPSPDRFHFRELRTPINGSGPTECLLLPIEHRASVEELVVSLASTGIKPHQHATLRHALCSVFAMEAPRPACMHCCSKQFVVLDPNVMVWDTWFECGVVPALAVLTDVPSWPTIRLVADGRLTVALHNQPAHVLLRA